jgi:hypothetical protein
MIWQFFGSDHGQTLTVVLLNILLTVTNALRSRRNTHTLKSIHVKVNGRFDALIRRVDKLEKRKDARNP